ncbi:MAG: hypothetical protein IJC17_06570 [Clostridia bacterium]|nr:hypothetical protein [Clostridia bacterium]
MCEICLQTPCASGCPNAAIVPERRICAWCDSPIFDEYYYDIDGDTVCAECLEECRCSVAGKEWGR